MIAMQAEAALKQRRDAQLGRNILVGAVIGTANRSDSAKKGAVFGALVGTADSTEDIKLGPRRIMDRCIANRGYDLLNNTLQRRFQGAKDGYLKGGSEVALS